MRGGRHCTLESRPHLGRYGRASAARQSNALGYGVFKSTDGGKTWQHLGLELTEQIGDIIIHPRDPNIVYVAALGHLWGCNPERGVYKTTNGGKSWDRVLFVDDMSGAADLAVDPTNPDVLYVSIWTRMRSGGAPAREAGPGSGIYKITDARGVTWTRLTSGLPNEPLSKITIKVLLTRANLIYAFMMSGEGGAPTDPSSGPAVEDFSGGPLAAPATPVGCSALTMAVRRGSESAPDCHHEPTTRSLPLIPAMTSDCGCSTFSSGARMTEE